MARKGFKAGERLQMMLSRETISGIIMTGGHNLHLSLFQMYNHTHCAYTTYTLMWCVVNSFVELGKKLLGIPGVKAVFSERFNQDPLESFFGKQRQRGYRDNPTVKDFIYGTQSLRVQGSLARDPKRGNCRKGRQDKQGDIIDDVPLPKRRRYSGSRK